MSIHSCQDIFPTFRCFLLQSSERCNKWFYWKSRSCQFSISLFTTTVFSSTALELIEKYPCRCQCDFRTGSDGIWGTQRVPKWPQHWWVNTLMKDNLAILCRIAPLRCSTTLITWLDRKCLWQPVKSVFIFFSLQTLSWVVGWFCDPDLPQGPLICCMLCSRLWYQ